MTVHRTTFDATERAAYMGGLQERRYEKAEIYNRPISYVQPWSDGERQAIEANILTALATDPSAAMEILEMLGFT